MKRKRTVISWLGNILLGAAVLGATVFAIDACLHGLGTLPGGYRSLVVLSGSMEPAVPTGSLVVTKSVDPATVKVGDVITFRLESGPLAGKLATHRVVAVENGPGGLSFVTKGDANPVPDPAPVPARDLVGRVMGVSVAAGMVFQFVRTPVFLVLIALGAAILLVTSLRPKTGRTRAAAQPPLPGAAVRTPGLRKV